jgi:glucokinase
VVERVARCVRDAADEADLSPKQIKAVGIGAPGAVDPAKGEVLFAPNLQWKNAPLQKELEKHLGIPVFIENDCNACTLGVHEVEMKAKPRNLLGIFLGTGIGGGLILDGRLFSGFNHTAGEIGHMVLEVGGPKCGCGNLGCFEALASRTAIFRELARRAKEGEKTVLTDFLQGGETITDLKSGDLRKALRRGDKLTEKVVESAAEYTGIAIANLANILGPEVIVLGGGVAGIGEPWREAVARHLPGFLMEPFRPGPDVRLSALGRLVVPVGAALAAARLRETSTGPALEIQRR